MPRRPTILIATGESVASAHGADGRAATKARRYSNVVPLHRGAFMDPDEIARRFEGQSYLAHSRIVTEDHPLVAFFRRWQFCIFVGCYVVAVATACYFAFQIGLGAL